LCSFKLWFLEKINYYFHILYNQLKDTRVWIPDADKVWKPAQVYENYKQNDKKIKLIFEDESVSVDKIMK
jgi:hypothetical protein